MTSVFIGKTLYGNLDLDMRIGRTVHQDEGRDQNDASKRHGASKIARKQTNKQKTSESHETDSHSPEKKTLPTP